MVVLRRVVIQDPSSRAAEIARALIDSSQECALLPEPRHPQRSAFFVLLKPPTAFFYRKTGGARNIAFPNLPGSNFD